MDNLKEYYESPLFTHLLTYEDEATTLSNHTKDLIKGLKEWEELKRCPINLTNVLKKFDKERQSHQKI